MEEQKQKVYSNAADEIAAIELSIKRAQLADLELQKTERQLSIEEKRGTIADRVTKQKQKAMDREQQGKVFAAQKREDDAKQNACTHKKGGVVSQRNLQVLSTGGNSPQYAVIKHQMINGDFWVRCLRCGKTWLPPVKDNFYFSAKGKVVAPVDGVFSLSLIHISIPKPGNRQHSTTIAATLFETWTPECPMAPSIAARWYKIRACRLAHAR